MNIQTTFESYEKLYRKLVEEGFHEFGLDECTEENIYAVWMYKDMQKMGQVLARSDLNWTLVRTCPGRDGKVKKVGQNCSISLDGSQFRPGYSREALAEFLYEAAADQQMYSRKMPIFYREG